MRSSAGLTREDRARLDDASDWMVRLQSEAEDETVVSAWLEWYSVPENRVAFDEMQGLDVDLRGLDAGARARFAERFATSEPRSARRSVVAWPAWRASVAALAGVAALVVALAWNMGWFAGEASSGTYQTERGANRVVNLADGSVVRLGASSALSLNFTREARYLVLESGEALFEVAKDPARPFIVQAGIVRVKAIGTQFNVRRADGNTFVSVREGTVEVTHDRQSAKTPASDTKRRESTPRAPEVVELHAGEQAAALPSAPSLAVFPVVPEAVASWQHGRFEFIDEPLVSVVATVNRYSKREIVIAEPAALGDLKFTGIVHEDRIDDWVSAIQEIFPLKVSVVGKRTILLGPANP